LIIKHSPKIVPLGSDIFLYSIS